MDWLVYIFSGIAIASALMVITRKNPIVSALYLALTLFAVAGLFVIFEAYFIAAVQVLVYAGAVMVLFIFVIMLLNLEPEKYRISVFRAPRVISVIAAITLFGSFAAVFFYNRVTGTVGLETPDAVAQAGGYLPAISTKLFTHYLLPFEVTSVLLLVAMVGVVVLAKRVV
ncbi:NADH-quinone oxidoreductase subunit J [Bdellovibrionota bacterium]